MSKSLSNQPSAPAQAEARVLDRDNHAVATRYALAALAAAGTALFASQAGAQTAEPTDPPAAEAVNFNTDYFPDAAEMLDLLAQIPVLKKQIAADKITETELKGRRDGYDPNKKAEAVARAFADVAVPYPTGKLAEQQARLEKMVARLRVLNARFATYMEEVAHCSTEETTQRRDALALEKARLEALLKAMNPDITPDRFLHDDDVDDLALQDAIDEVQAQMDQEGTAAHTEYVCPTVSDLLSRAAAARFVPEHQRANKRKALAACLRGTNPGNMAAIPENPADIDDNDPRSLREKRYLNPDQTRILQASACVNGATDLEREYATLMADRASRAPYGFQPVTAATNVKKLDKKPGVVYRRRDDGSVEKLEGTIGVKDNGSVYINRPHAAGLTEITGDLKRDTTLFYAGTGAAEEDKKDGETGLDGLSIGASLDFFNAPGERWAAGLRPQAVARLPLYNKDDHMVAVEARGGVAGMGTRDARATDFGGGINYSPAFDAGLVYRGKVLGILGWGAGLRAGTAALGGVAEGELTVTVGPVDINAGIGGIINGRGSQDEVDGGKLDPRFNAWNWKLGARVNAFDF